MVYSPIVHCHPVALLEDLPGEVEYWWVYNQRMIRVCDLFVVLNIEGALKSKGVRMEQSYAGALSKETLWMAEGSQKGEYVCPWLDSIIPAV